MFMTKREKWLIYGLMILATLVTVVPFIWMIITSFKTQAESIAFPPILLPANPGFQAYGKILHEMPFGSFYFNSIVSTLVIVILQTLIAAMAAYGFSRLRFKGRDVLFMLCISILMVPGQIFLIPQFLTVEKIGLLNSIPGLVLPGLFSIYSAFLLRQFFLSVPKELEEAAIVDGANLLQQIWYVELPAIKDIIVIQFILQAGNIMSIGFEKAYALQTDMNLPASEILSTYVYRIGLLNGDYGYSTAVGLFNSVINVILLIFVNWVVKKLNDGEGL